MRHAGREGKRMKQVAHQWAFAGIPVGIVVGYARIGVLPDWLFYPGEALVVAGLAVTEDGPYRYVRHPGYLGQIVAFIELGLALQAWVALLVILIVAAVASRSVDWRYRMRASVQPRPSSDRAAGHSGCAG